ncbi:hypothetical protein [uncultured Chitinophaga sp.]|uniref:hypothetical protein n=1 Tax=uncultured Chitinophaga sp. TaxID=339340 RepID=UPI0025D6F694|nr:hypothetical protein [uncultured Chitinophaga sp.]
MSELIKTWQPSKKWLAFSQIASWVLSVAGTFIIVPPLLKLSNELDPRNLVRFLIAACVAVLYIPARRKSQPKDYKFWYYAAIAALVIFVSLTACYTYVVRNWSVNFYGQTLVIGKNMYPEAVQKKAETAILLERPFIDNETFVKARVGETQYIWPEDELKNRFYMMSTLYSITILTLAFFLLSVTQAMYCYDKAHQINKT